jgi:hypothetical protein
MEVSHRPPPCKAPGSAAPDTASAPLFRGELAWPRALWSTKRRCVALLATSRLGRDSESLKHPRRDCQEKATAHAEAASRSATDREILTAEPTAELAVLGCRADHEEARAASHVASDSAGAADLEEAVTDAEAMLRAVAIAGRSARPTSGLDASAPPATTGRPNLPRMLRLS